MSRWSRSRRHTILDEVLVENAELERQEEELFNGNATKSSPRKDSAAAAAAVHDSPDQHSITESSSSTAAADSTSVIMMYSPYIPSIDEQHGVITGNSAQSADVANYYSRIDTEETVKCVVSSVLFCAVVIMIVLVAVFKNPGM